jgi:hypothetical protein
VKTVVTTLRPPAQSALITSMRSSASRRKATRPGDGSRP